MGLSGTEKLERQDRGEGLFRRKPRREKVSACLETVW